MVEDVAAISWRFQPHGFGVESRCSDSLACPGTNVTQGEDFASVTACKSKALIREALTGCASCTVPIQPGINTEKWWEGADDCREEGKV